MNILRYLSQLWLLLIVASSTTALIVPAGTGDAADVNVFTFEKKTFGNDYDDQAYVADQAKEIAMEVRTKWEDLSARDKELSEAQRALLAKVTAFQKEAARVLEEARTLREQERKSSVDKALEVLDSGRDSLNAEALTKELQAFAQANTALAAEAEAIQMLRVPKSGEGLSSEAAQIFRLVTPANYNSAFPDISSPTQRQRVTNARAQAAGRFFQAVSVGFEGVRKAITANCKDRSAWLTEGELPIIDAPEATVRPLRASSENYREVVTEWAERAAELKTAGLELGDDYSKEDLNLAIETNKKTVAESRWKVAKDWTLSLRTLIAQANAIIATAEKDLGGAAVQVRSFLLGKEGKGGLSDTIRMAQLFRDGKSDTTQKGDKAKKAGAIEPLLPARFEFEDLMAWFDSIKLEASKQKLANLAIFEHKDARYNLAVEFLNDYFKKLGARSGDGFSWPEPPSTDSSAELGEDSSALGVKAIPSDIRYYFKSPRSKMLSGWAAFSTKPLTAYFAEVQAKMSDAAKIKALKEQLVGLLKNLWHASEDEGDTLVRAFYSALTTLEEKQEELTSLVEKATAETEADFASKETARLTPKPVVEDAYERLKQIYGDSERAQAIFQALQKARKAAGKKALPLRPAGAGDDIADRLFRQRFSGADAEAGDKTASKAAASHGYRGSRLGVSPEDDEVENSLAKQLDQEINFAGDEDSGREARGQRALIFESYSNVMQAKVQRVVDYLEAESNALASVAEDEYREESNRKSFARRALAMVRTLEATDGEIDAVAERLQAFVGEKKATELSAALRTTLMAQVNKYIEQAAAVLNLAAMAVGEALKASRLPKGERDFLDAELITLSTMFSYLIDKISEEKAAKEKEAPTLALKAHFASLPADMLTRLQEAKQSIEDAIKTKGAAARATRLESAGLLDEYTVTELAIQDRFTGIERKERQQKHTTSESATVSASDDGMTLVCGRSACNKPVGWGVDSKGNRLCDSPFRTYDLLTERGVTVAVQTDGGEPVDCNRRGVRYVNLAQWSHIKSHSGGGLWVPISDASDPFFERIIFKKTSEAPYTQAMPLTFVEINGEEHLDRSPAYLRAGQRYVLVDSQEKNAGRPERHAPVPVVEYGKKPTREQAYFLAAVDAIQAWSGGKPVSYAELSAADKIKFAKALDNISVTFEADKTVLERLAHLDLPTRRDFDGSVDEEGKPAPRRNASGEEVQIQNLQHFTLGELKRVCELQGVSSVSDFTSLPNFAPIDWAELYEAYKKAAYKHFDEVVSAASPLFVEEFKAVSDYFRELKNRLESRPGKMTLDEVEQYQQATVAAIDAINNLVYDIDIRGNERSNYREEFYPRRVPQPLKTLIDTLKEAYLKRKPEASGDPLSEVFKAQTGIFKAIADAVLLDNGDRTSGSYVALGRGLDEATRSAKGSKWYYFTSLADVRAGTMKGEEGPVLNEDELKKIQVVVEDTEETLHSLVTGVVKNKITDFAADNVFVYVPGVGGSDKYRIVITKSATQKRQAKEEIEGKDASGITLRGGKGRALTSADDNSVGIKLDGGKAISIGEYTRRQNALEEEKEKEARSVRESLLPKLAATTPAKDPFKPSAFRQANLVKTINAFVTLVDGEASHLGAVAPHQLQVDDFLSHKTAKRLGRAMTARLDDVVNRRTAALSERTRKKIIPAKRIAGSDDITEKYLETLKSQFVPGTRGAVEARALIDKVEGELAKLNKMNLHCRSLIAEAVSLKEAIQEEADDEAKEAPAPAHDEKEADKTVEDEEGDEKSVSSEFEAEEEGNERYAADYRRLYEAFARPYTVMGLPVIVAEVDRKLTEGEGAVSELKNEKGDVKYLLELVGNIGNCIDLASYGISEDADDADDRALAGIIANADPMELITSDVPLVHDNSDGSKWLFLRKKATAKDGSRSDGIFRITIQGGQITDMWSAQNETPGIIPGRWQSLMQMNPLEMTKTKRRDNNKNLWLRNIRKAFDLQIKAQQDAGKGDLLGKVPKFDWKYKFTGYDDSGEKSFTFDGNPVEVEAEA